MRDLSLFVFSFRLEQMIYFYSIVSILIFVYFVGNLITLVKGIRKELDPPVQMRYLVNQVLLDLFVLAFCIEKVVGFLSQR